MCTLPSEDRVIETSPEVLCSSRRMGPLTLRVRSRLPLAEGPMAQPAAATVAKSKVTGTATAGLRRFISPPRAVKRTRARLLHLPTKRYADGGDYVPKRRRAQARCGLRDSFNEPCR